MRWNAVPRKFSAVACLVSMALSIFAPYAAFATGLKLVVRDLQFETRANGQILDSTFVSRGSGIVASAENADTTAVFSSLDWTLPGPYAAGATTAAGGDTISWLRVTVVPEGTGITVAADTIGVILQVSDDDGTTWTNTTWTGPAIDPDVAAMGQAAILETGTSNCFKFTLRQQVGAPSTSGPFMGTNATPTANMVYGWRALRFIFTGDHTGKYKCKLIGFQNSGDN